MKDTILAILEDVIDDFNGKWESHADVQRGLESYAENIMTVIKKTPKPNIGKSFFCFNTGISKKKCVTQCDMCRNA